MEKDNSISVLIKLVKLLKLKINAKSISEELEKHPDHPSLFAINDILNYWKVPNVAYQVAHSSLKDVPVPYIVHLNNNGGEFAVVEEINEKDIYLSKHDWDRKKMNLASFEPIFSGNILYAEPDIDSGEENYLEQKRKEQLETLKFPLLLGSALFVLFLTVWQQTSFFQVLNWQITLLFILKSAGLSTSLMLLWHSIDANNPLIEKLCSGDNKNCNAILSSKAAKITDYLSWSEVGFFYYAGTWIALLFYSNNLSMLQLLAYLSIACLPYSFYSVYYQARVAKQWCVFCLTIQVLFWLEAFVFIPTLLQPFQLPALNTFISIFISLSLPILIWTFIKPILLQSVKIDPLKAQLKRFKYNDDIFNGILAKQKQYQLLDDTDTIILGNIEAENTLTIVSNPYCQPCAKAHHLLDTWLTERDNFRLQIIFSTQNSDEDPKTAVAKHLHRIGSESPKLLKDAVHAWYENKHKGFEEWKNSYPIKQEAGCPQLAKQQLWCKEAEVRATPTFFLNGYRVPNLWQLEDIKYMI